MKLLLVEDNKHLANDMQAFLADSGYIVECVSNLSEALDKISIYDYDLIILDLGLPDGNGLTLLEYLKAKNRASGVLIVTAKDAIEDKVKGLELGADDYVTKPFHQAELIARVKSIIRRKNFKGNNQLTVGELTADLSANEILVNGHSLTLTRKEYDLLLYFMYNKNKVITKESIAEHLWGDDIDQVDHFDFIYNHVKNVRKKIAKADGFSCIKSVYGMGYKMIE
ncbi:MAG: response regulator transcription factor [Carboxylicivirga sp.]|jgi:DNA-binding response OmpR family regulator|nr:response regulator transcription factor [Carboxylicivirga sp.]